jgi:predicted dehydrogenase
MPGVRLVGVADLDPDRASAIAAEYDCEPFTDARELCGRVQAASVAVPTVGHLEVARTLLEGGADVLVEKPLARSLSEARAINEIAERSGKLVMVGHTERFNPAVRALAAAVSEPRFLEIHRLAGFSERSTDIDVVLDLMIHDLDLLLCLDGSDPVEVDAVGIGALTDKVDIANARVRLASGCVANLTASRISAEPLRRLRVFQHQTYLSGDTGKRTVERYRLVMGKDGTPRIDREQLPVEDGEPLGFELQTFVEAVRTRVSPNIDGRQGQRVIEFAERVLESIRANANRA